MTDEPTRLLDESESELLRALLGAAREEQPQPAALRRTLTAVGVGVSAVAVASSSNARAAVATSATAGGASLTSAKAAVPTSLIVGKWLGFGLITGLVATTAVYTVSDAMTPDRPAEPPAAVVSPQPTPLAPAAPTTLPNEVASAVSAAPSIEPAPAAVSGALPALSASTAEPEPPLAVEVATLDSARHALKTGDPARALSLLDGYERRFPDARMLPEALFIRMQAFNRKGDDSGALAVAERIVRTFPKSPHAARARALLAAAK